MRTLLSLLRTRKPLEFSWADTRVRGEENDLVIEDEESLPWNVDDGFPPTAPVRLQARRD